MGFGFPTVLRRVFVLAMLVASPVRMVCGFSGLHLSARHPWTILQMYHHRGPVLLASLASTTT